MNIFWPTSGLNLVFTGREHSFFELCR